jgi:hypothetical protein
MHHISYSKSLPQTNQKTHLPTQSTSRLNPNQPHIYSPKSPTHQYRQRPLHRPLLRRPARAGRRGRPPDRAHGRDVPTVPLPQADSAGLLPDVLRGYQRSDSLVGALRGGRRGPLHRLPPPLACVFLHFVYYMPECALWSRVPAATCGIGVYDDVYTDGQIWSNLLPLSLASQDPKLE